MSSIFSCLGEPACSECVEVIARLYFGKVAVNITESYNEDELRLLTCSCLALCIFFYHYILSKSYSLIDLS